MAIKFKQWKPPGVYLKDIRKYTGYADVKGACEKAGVKIWMLNNKEFSPLSLQETYRVLRVIRSLQGQRLLTKIRKIYSV